MTALIETTADLLRRRLGSRRPRIAVLLGSGWASFADGVGDALDVPYAELPAFPALAVGGHRALLRAGRLGGVELLVLSGRQHAYETGRVDGMSAAIRSLAAAGIDTLVQTNAAGSLDFAMRPGDLMLVADHLNLPQRSPLWGEGADAPFNDTRFQDLSVAYDKGLRERALRVAKAQGVHLFEGVYAWVMGPQFETPAEIRMLQVLGAQAVGMSTVPETIVARHAGMRVMALSMLTNMGAGMEHDTLSHAHTLATASEAGARAVSLLAAVVQAIGAPAHE